MKLHEMKHIVFCHEHYNPAGLIRSLGEAGIRPDVIVVKGYPVIASKSRYINKLTQVNSIQEGYNFLLRFYGHEEKGRQPFLYTADDEIMSFLDQRYDELKDKFHFFNAGEKNRITYFMDKYNVSMLAKECGFKVAEMVVVDKGVIPSNLTYPIITKAISSNSGAWKKDVFICKSDEELRDAYRKIKGTKIILQHYVDKKNELCLEGLAVNRGESVFIGIGTNYKYLLPGTYSPWMNVFNFNNTQIMEGIRRLFKEIRYEGVFDIEFIIDKSDKMYFMEINFRNSAWSYASTCAGMNLPYIWALTSISGSEPANYYKEIPDGFCAIVEPTDFKTRVLGRKVGLLQWIKQLKSTNCWFYYNKHDRKPFWWWIFTRRIKR